MRKYLFLLLITMSLGCMFKKKDAHVSFRLLPCDYVTNYSDKKPAMLRLYAVETNSDTADVELVRKIDSFLCTQVNTVVHIRNYSDLVMRFLKETELTKQLKDTSITDAHNPTSSIHFTFAQYQWSNQGEHFSKWLNNEEYLSKDTILKCP